MNALFLVAVLAQTPAPLPQPTRADVHFVVGWQNLKKQQPQNSYNDWLNGILYGGAGAGWDWTDNLKTQIDFGAGTRAEQYRTRQFPVGSGGAQAYESSRLSVRQQSVAIGQQYQFFHNQWFHPHVGAGLDIARETTREEFLPVVVYDNPVSRTISPAHSEGPDHRIVTRGFGEVGFKAY